MLAIYLLLRAEIRVLGLGCEWVKSWVGGGGHGGSAGERSSWSQFLSPPENDVGHTPYVIEFESDQKEKELH
jgi:hypothetical protein